MTHPLPRTHAALLSGIDQGQHLGAQLYVSLHGRTVVDEAVGHARENEPLTTEHLMLWMSGGKPLTAAMVLRAAEQGRLCIDDHVTDYLPEFGRNGKQDITIRHILTHTAGFRGPLNNFTPGTWEQIIERVFSLRQEPGWSPGFKAGYHVGSSWFVLGELLRVVGQPLGGRLPFLDDVWISLDENEQAELGTRIAPMFVVEEFELEDDFVGNEPPLMTVPRPGASIRGPIRQLGRFYEQLLAGGGTILSERSALQMTRRQRRGMLDLTFKQVIDWGLGVMIDSKQYAGLHAYGCGPHASPDTFGHGGNQSTCGFADPLHGLVVAWACNGMPGEQVHQQRANTINAAIYEDLGLA